MPKTHDNSKKYPGVKGTLGIDTRKDDGMDHSKEALEKKGQ